MCQCLRKLKNNLSSYHPISWPPVPVPEVAALE